MVDVYEDSYYKMYQCSKKIDKKFDSFALITFYNRETKEFIRKEIKLESQTLLDFIECKTPDMVSVVMYTRGIGLIDDFEVYGRPENIGRTIYFGTLISVAEYNAQNRKSLSLPLDRQVCKLDCGEVLTEVETYCDTSANVVNEYNKLISNGHGVILN